MTRRCISGILGAILVVFVLACYGQQQHAATTGTVDVDNQIAKLKKQLETSPNSGLLHEQLGVLLSWKGDWDESDREMKIAMELEPNNPIFCIDAAQSYRIRGLPTKESEMLKRAVAIDPKNPVSHFILGLMYEHRSDPERAMAEFREAKRLIDTLSGTADHLELRNVIIPGPDGRITYFDQFGQEYILDDILKPLEKKLAK